MSIYRLREPWRYPSWPLCTSYNPGGGGLVGDTSLLDAVGDRVCLYGDVFWADGSTKSARYVHWRSGGNSHTGTARVRFSALDTANGPALRDDLSVAENGTHTNVAASTNFTTTLSADRSIAHGSRQMLVWEITAHTSGGFRVAGHNTAGAGRWPFFPTVTHYDGSAYAQSAVMVGVTLEASDGTLGWFQGAFPRIGPGGTAPAITSSSSPRGVGIEFTVDEPLWCCGGAIHANASAVGSDGRLALYDGTTLARSFTFDGNSIATFQQNAIQGSWAEYALVAGTTYRLMLEATTPNSLQVPYFDFAAGSAGSMTPVTARDLVFRNAYYATHDGTPTFSATNTRMVMAWVNICGFDDGAGGGGGTTYYGPRSSFNKGFG